MHQYISKYGIYGLFVCVIIALYGQTIFFDFVLDDDLAIKLHHSVTQGWAGIPDIITQGYRSANFGGQFYRPVPLIMFAIEYAIAPDNPMIHHIVNILCYAISIIFAYKLMVLLISDSLSSNIILGAMLIFAVHPIHTEVVANIKSRDEIMSFLFLMASLIQWYTYIQNKVRYNIFLSMVFYSLSLLSKEGSIAMAPVFIAMSVLYDNNFKKSFLNALWSILPVLIFYFGVRYLLFVGQTNPPVDVMDNPLVAVNDISTRLLTSLALVGRYIYLFIWPYPLSSDYSYQVIPYAGWFDINVWTTIIFTLFALYTIYTTFKSNKPVCLAFIGFGLSMVIPSQIFILIGTMFGERLAYLGSFWFVLSALLILHEWSKYLFRRKSIGIKPFWSTISLALIVCMYCIMSVYRIPAWQNNFTLFTTDVSTYPSSVRLHNGAADQYYVRGLQDTMHTAQWFAKAKYHCTKIMEIKPVATAFLTLGNINLYEKNFEQAILNYDNVNDLDDIVRRNKALTYKAWGKDEGMRLNNLSNAEKYLHLSYNLNQEDPETWSLLGVCLGIQGKHTDALPFFLKAFTQSPTPELGRNIAIAYKETGQTEQYEKFKQFLQ